MIGLRGWKISAGSGRLETYRAFVQTIGCLKKIGERGVTARPNCPKLNPDEDAVERAEKILAQLPYEKVGDEACLRDRESEESEESEVEMFRQMEEIAKRIGLALQLHQCRSRR